MPYSDKIQEKLKTYIYTNKLSKFKELYNAIKITNLSEAKEYLNGTNDEDRCLLSWAAIENFGAPFIEFLLEQGANVNHEDAKRWTPLDMAVHYNKFDTLRALCGAKAAAGAGGSSGTAVTSKTIQNALFRAAHDAGYDIIEFLFAHGADIKAKDTDGATPFHIAARYNLEALHAFVKLRAKEVPKLINMKDADGNTPLHYAAYDTSGKKATYLLTLGADRTVTNNEGYVPAQVAEAWDSYCTTKNAITNYDSRHPLDPEEYYTSVTGESEDID